MLVRAETLKPTNKEEVQVKCLLKSFEDNPYLGRTKTKKF